MILQLNTHVKAMTSYHNNQKVWTEEFLPFRKIKVWLVMQKTNKQTNPHIQTDQMTTYNLPLTFSGPRSSQVTLTMWFHSTYNFNREGAGFPDTLLFNSQAKK